MFKYLENFLRTMRPAFSRKATFVWFVIVFVGFLLRNDTFGVSSIVRALSLIPKAGAHSLSVARFALEAHQRDTSFYPGRELPRANDLDLVRSEARRHHGRRLV